MDANRFKTNYLAFFTVILTDCYKVHHLSSMSMCQWCRTGWHATMWQRRKHRVCVVCMRCNHSVNVYQMIHQYHHNALNSAFSIQTRKYFDSFTTVWNWRWLKVAVGLYKERRDIYTHTVRLHCVLFIVIFLVLFQNGDQWRWTNGSLRSFSKLFQ